jgi:hypothetical protein
MPKGIGYGTRAGRSAGKQVKTKGRRSTHGSVVSAIARSGAGGTAVRAVARKAGATGAGWSKVRRARRI